MSRKQWGHGYHAGIEAAKGSIRGSSKKLTADKAILCWNHGGNVRVFEFPPPDGYYGRWDKFDYTTLACNFYVQDMNYEQRKMMVFVEAMHLIVRDECNPLDVHNALLNLEEYCDGCASDMPGINRIGDYGF